MRIAELSRYSGVTVPTIKFYVREGLLAPGELTSPNQAQYGDDHLRRLKLIRALVEVGGLSIAATRDALATVDDAEGPVNGVLSDVQQAAHGSRSTGADETGEASGMVADLLNRLGWTVSESSPARRALASIVTTLQDLGYGDVLTSFDGYAMAAAKVAESDAAALGSAGDAKRRREAAAILAVVGSKAFSTLRQLAHESATGSAREHDGHQSSRARPGLDTPGE